MSSKLLKQISICTLVLILGAPRAELFAQTPTVNCSTEKKACKTAVKRSKKDVKTMNKESAKLEKYASRNDTYVAKRDNCVQNIQQIIDNRKIDAQIWAERCGTGVIQAVESAQIWTTAQLSDNSLDEAQTLANIDTTITGVLGSLAASLEDYVAGLIGLPDECSSYARIIGNPGACLSAILRGEGCSKVEQCGYIEGGPLGEYTIPGRTKIGEPTCTSNINSCKAQKRAQKEREQQEQIQACAQVKRIVRDVYKKKLNVQRCQDRFLGSQRRLQSQVDASKLRYCTASASYGGVTKPDEDAKCATYESASCGGARPYYDVPTTTPVTCG